MFINWLLLHQVVGKACIMSWSIWIARLPHSYKKILVNIFPNDKEISCKWIKTELLVAVLRSKIGIPQTLTSSNSRIGNRMTFENVNLTSPRPVIQYIPGNMHTVFALLCFVVVIHWLIFPYPSGLLHWHCGNLTIAPVPAKQPWWIWINNSCEFNMNDCISTTKQSTTKPCAYFLGYTVSIHKHFGAILADCFESVSNDTILLSNLSLVGDYHLLQIRAVVLLYIKMFLTVTLTKIYLRIPSLKNNIVLQIIIV